jgi:tetratricopeptide (TPR) repeat protein
LISIRSLLGAERSRLVPLVAGGLLALGILACTSPAEKVDAHLEKAASLLDGGDDKGALIELRSALKIAPQRADLNLRIAQLLARDEEKTADSLFFYQEAYRLDPSMDEARLAAAEILATPDRPQARSLVEEVLGRDPANARAHGLKSRLLLLDNDLDGAVAAALVATELAPADGEGFLRLGRAHQARLQLAQTNHRVPEEATFRAGVEAFERAADLYQKAGDSDGRTMAEFERARVLAAWPGHTDEAKSAYLGMIDAAAADGSPKRVRAASEMAFSFATASGDDAVIHDVLERIVERDPSHLIAWGSLAALQRRMGQSDEATLQRMIEKQPRSAAAQAIRAESLIARGDRDGAIQALEGAVGQVEEATALQLTLLDLLFAAGRNEEATRLIETMQREAPTDPNTRLAKALLAMREGRLAEAAGLLRGVTAESENLRGQAMLAESELRLGNLEAATQAVDRGYEFGGNQWVAGAALRLAIQRASRDWSGVLRSAETLQRLGQTLNPEQHFAVIEALYETGRGAEGRQRLDVLLAGPSASPAARLLFAQREGAADPARARALLEEGVAADPQARALIHQLAVMDAEAGRRDQALARLDAYLDGRPEDDAPGLRLLRSRLRAQAGDLAGAEQDALAAFKAAPQFPGAAELVAALYVEQGRTAEAIQSFESALAQGSLPRPARTVLARFYSAEGRNDDAIRVLEEVVKEGGGPPPKNDLAFLLARDKRDLDRALALAQEAVGGGAEEPTYFDTLGFVYLQKGLYVPALDQFEQAIDLAERRGAPRAEFLFHKGLALQGLERPADAVQAFEAALSLDPAFQEAGEARASLEKARAAAGAGSS